MIIHAVRAVYLVIVLAFTTSFAFRSAVYLQGPTYVSLYILVPAMSAFALVMVDMFWRRKHLQVLSGLFFGLLAGLVIAYVLSLIVDLVGNVFAVPPAETETIATSHLSPAPPVVITTQPIDEQVHPQPVPPLLAVPLAAQTPILDLLKVLLGASAVFLCVSFVLQTKDDFRFVIPYVEFTKQTKGARPLLLDTSVIIDGRIVDIADTGIIEAQMIVPRFVLGELHTIADSDDKLKRNRGRRGLDILNRLRENKKIDLQIADLHAPAIERIPEVDAKLVALGKHLDAKVVTNDYNLNKIARLRGVDVININDLANALRPAVLPGESMSIKIIKPGEESGQGVGYLEDGTMVVAEQARASVGQEISGPGPFNGW